LAAARTSRILANSIFPLSLALYAYMNQPYRVRLKTKTKIRLAALFILFLLVLGGILFYVINLDFGIKPDKIYYGRTYLLVPYDKGTGSNMNRSTSSYGMFKLPSGKKVTANLISPSINDGFYCLAEIKINGKVSRYQVVKSERCV